MELEVGRERAVLKIRKEFVRYIISSYILLRTLLCTAYIRVHVQVIYVRRQYTHIYMKAPRTCQVNFAEA
jgi:hypothetical protein